MSTEKKFIADGYRFLTEEEYKEALREIELISDLKRNNDLTEDEKLRGLYDSLIENEEFRTPIGLGFLREAQKRLMKDPMHKKTMRAIPVIRSDHKIIGQTDYEALNFTLREKMKHLRIVVFFSVLVALISFGFAIYDRTLAPERVKEEVLDRYAGWKQELQEKERKLREAENRINEEREALKRMNKNNE